MSVSTISPFGSQNTFMVTSQALLPVVNKFFDQISPAEWILLAAGIKHPATEATLVNMLVEIVQALSAAVLRVVVPIFQEHLSNTTSPVELETYNTHLGDSLSQCFSTALDVPQVRSQSILELSTLIEKEVSERIRSVLSTAANSTCWPSEPAVYVPPTMSNSRNLHRMVSHAFTCLKGLLHRMCLRPKDIEVERCQSIQSINSDISVPSVTKAVSDILQKWSSDTVSHTEEAETSLVPLSDSLEAHDAASEIVTMISEDLQHPVFGDIICCSERSSSRPRYNIRLALDKVRDFFAGQAIPPEDAIQVLHKHTFFKIARNQFQTTMEELKSAFQCNDTDFVISLKQDSSRSLLRIMEEVEEVTLPGAIPEPPRPESRPASRTTMTSFGDLSSPPLDFDTIKNDLDDLFDKSDLQGATCTSNKLENVALAEEIRKFSRELTDKMYHHLMNGQMYQIPILPMGRSLSDSVISERTFKIGTTRPNFSPEVLYAMTEDAVGKFCQLMLHWLEKEPSVRRSYDEKVCGAFAEIDDLITRSLTPTEEDNIRPDSPEAPTSQEVIFVGPESPETPTSQEVIFVGPESPETPTSQEVIFVGPESPETPTSQEVIFVGPESPETPTSLEVIFVGPESPETPTSQEVIFVGPESPETPTSQEVIFVGPESPETPTSQEVIFVGPESPETPTSQEVIFVGPESPETPTSLEVIFVGPESPETPTSQEVIVVEPESPEASKTLTTTPSTTYKELTPSDIRQPDFCFSNDICDRLNVRLHVDSRTLASKNVPERKPTSDLVWEETKGFRPGTLASSSTLAPLSIKSSKGQSSSGRDKLTASTVDNFVCALVIRLIGRIPWKVKKDMRIDSMNAIINRVSERAQAEGIMMLPSLSKAKDVKKVNKAVIKDLLHQYKTPKQLLKAALAKDDPTFTSSVVKYLNIHVKALVDPPPKNSKVATFFKAVGKALAKPFRLCFMDTSDD
ncbi:uncharacterized protein LOC121882773 [Thunnus maccoyii]|uniref:uncharacterized protein LOC121882773 n=1 Tax=Thunnus maccoyii TaxID=8240 RepID=UPI001C4D16AD|nr:uncharacterized protein LOC121882773 [Thunnus maccoyii]